MYVLDLTKQMTDPEEFYSWLKAQSQQMKSDEFSPVFRTNAQKT